MLKKLWGAGVLLALAAFASAPAMAVPINFTFTGSVDGNPYTAHALLHVSGGQALDGTGTITGAGLTGTQSLTLITLASPGVEVDGGGLLGYRSNDGTDWFNADTVIPIDSNGIIFAIGPGPVGFGTSQQFDVYDAGGGNFDAGFFGSASAVAPHYYAYNLPVNVTSATGVPEPKTIAMFGASLLGFGLIRRKSKKI